MARRVPEEYLAAIEAVVRGSGTALSAAEIEAGLAERIPRRTVQNRIAILVRGGRLTVEGTGRGTRYGVPERSIASVDVGLSEQEETPRSVRIKEITLLGEVGLHLTKAARQIQSHVVKPLEARTPIGYRQDFLDDYRPDRPYLSVEERERLHALGRTPAPHLPAGTHASEVLTRFLIDLSWNSSRLEGNTYTLLDTQRLLELGSEAPGKTSADARMILNHRAAVEFLVDGAAEVDFDRHTLCSLHALLSRDLLPDPGACGRLRSRTVAVTGTTFEPLAFPQRIEECFDRIVTRLRDIEDPFEQAFFAMVQLPYLQPFEDVNKRVSRLAANIPLIRHNLAPLSFSQVRREVYVQGLLGVYELNRVDLLRDVFLHAYRRSAARYAAVAESMDPEGGLRVKYRQALTELVGQLARERMDRVAAGDHVSRRAADVAADERGWFRETAQWELLGLHEGNCVLYGLTPADVAEWKKRWDA